jgi:cyclic pyranopterin phosphate synthase
MEIKMSKLTHFDNDGNPNMVDVSSKEITVRNAEATGYVYMEENTLNTIIDKKISKGDVFQIARLAGIMASKQTSSIIPLCHPLIIDKVTVNILPDENNSRVLISSSVTCRGSTGVEMEALTAVSASALTIYDMCKSIDRSMTIKDIKLIKKSGGNSGNWVRKSD